MIILHTFQNPSITAFRKTSGFHRSRKSVVQPLVISERGSLFVKIDSVLRVGNYSSREEKKAEEPAPAPEKK
jgi:hypothetical protein